MTRTVTLLGYATIVASAVALEVVARRSPRLSTLGDVLASVLRRPPWRLLLLAFWLWVGWHVFVRVAWR